MIQKYKNGDWLFFNCLAINSTLTLFFVKNTGKKNDKDGLKDQILPLI